MKKKKLTLQSIMLLLITCAMLGTFIGGIIATVIVSKENIQRNALTENEVYAQKLADTTDILFQNMFKTLQVSATNIYALVDQPDVLILELNQLLRSSNFFNAVYLVDKEGYIIKSMPKLAIEGTKITTVGVQEAVAKRSPSISQPYISQITGKPIVLVSVPVYNKITGAYYGFLGGTIHLNEVNSLKDTLNIHPNHSNGSYVYVVDSNGNIIYHPNNDRIGDNVMVNKVVEQVTQGLNGKMKVVNTKGIKMLAGYAQVKTSQWGIISQTPEESVVVPAYSSVLEVAKYTIPIIIIVYLASLLILKKAFVPLRNLAQYAQLVAKDQTAPRPAIPQNYFEVSELKQTMFTMVDYYNQQITTFEKEAQVDPLTGLLNRRSFNLTTTNHNEYSIVLLDIDNFKKVNDTYGHLKGDEVLIFLSGIVKEEVDEKGYCFRFGGEEFVILLPTCSIDEAFALAERLRERVEQSISPVGSTITISLGIGNMPYTATHQQELLNLVDQALYKAKAEGRNRTVIAEISSGK